MAKPIASKESDQPNSNPNPNPNSKRRMCPNVHCSTISIARTWKQPKGPSTDEWIKMYYIHTMEYYSVIKKNKFESVLVRWMNLEPIIRSEVT